MLKINALIIFLCLLFSISCSSQNKGDVNSSFSILIQNLNNSTNIDDFDIKYKKALKFIKTIAPNDSLFYELKKIKIDIYQRNFRFKEVKNDIIFFENSKSQYFKIIGLSRRAVDLLNSSNTKYALERLVKARDIAIKINANLELTLIYNIIGNLYAMDNKCETAIKYYHRALNLFNSSHNPSEIQKGIILNNISQAYYRIENFKKALYYHKEFYKVLNQTNYEFLKFMYFINDTSFQLTSKPIKARESLLKAKEIAYRSNNNFYLGSLYTTLSIIDYYENNFYNALKNIDLSINFFKNENANFYLKKSLTIKKYILKELKKYKELTELYETIDSLNTIIEKTYIDTYIQETEIKFDNSKKLKEIILLENEQKSQKNIRTILVSLFIITFLLVFILLNIIKKIKIEKLQQETFHKLKTLEKIAETEKREQNRIAKELHDIIGAQLLVLKFWIEDSKCCEKASSKIDNISNKLRLISHNLLNKDYSKQKLSSLIEDFTHNIVSSSTIKIDLFIDDFYKKNINYPLKLYLYKTIQELVSNSIKHGKAKTILINLYKEKDDVLFIVVEDDGNGFDVKNNLNFGIGIKNINEIISLVKGQFLIDSVIGVGTTVTIKFNSNKFKDFKNV